MAHENATSRFGNFHRLKTFWQDRSGAVTTDQMVLMAGIVGLGLAVIASYSNSAKTLATDRKESLTAYKSISSSATPPSAPTADGTTDPVN